MNRINYNWVLECALLSFDKPDLEYLKGVGASENEAKMGLLIYTLLNKKVVVKPPLQSLQQKEAINPFKTPPKPIRSPQVKQNYYSDPISLTTQFYFCPVPLRLDTFSGCVHNCVYCFANNSNVKGINNKDYKAEQTLKEVKPTKFEYVKEYFDVAFEGKPNKFNNQMALAVECIKHRVPLHFGGMSDPLQPLENVFKVTKQVLLLLKKYNYPVIFSTKGKLILSPEYYEIIKDYSNFALQISLIDDRQEVINILEPNAMTVNERLQAFNLYKDKWTACRIQPLIIGLNESRIIPLLDKLKAVGVNHIMVEGLKFTSGNKKANKRISDAFKQVTGHSYDLEAYYKSYSAKNSGNDLELPTWRKYKYVKIFAEEIKRRGMTFGCADNDLRVFGDSPCCCGVEGIKGFENIIKHNTGFAIFKSLRENKNVFDYNIIKDEWFPDGKFRTPMSNKKALKQFGWDKNNPTSNRPLKEMFNRAWCNGCKNSPCDVCTIKHLGNGSYKFYNIEEQLNILNDDGEQKLL